MISRLERFAALGTVTMLDLTAIMDGLSPFDDADHFASLADWQAVEHIPGTPVPFRGRLDFHPARFLHVD